jgi:hypothetical protein
MLRLERDRGYIATSMCLARGFSHPLLIMVVLAAAVAESETRPAPQELISRAHQLADLSSLGPYVMTADVIVNPGSKQEQAGRLVVHRDAAKARVDLEFGNRVDSRVTVGPRVYYDPMAVLIGGDWLNQIDRAWDSGVPVWRGEASYKLEKLSSSHIGGRDAWCM